MSVPRRVAILGIFLESNSFAEPTGEDAFRKFLYLEGGAILEDARSRHPRLMKEATGFVARMDARGGWTPVPLIVTSGSTGGPAEHGFFAETLDRIAGLLEAAQPLDGAYICNHGAMTTTQMQDADGAVYARVREILGPGTPVVATIDPHGNVSGRMIDSLDVLVAYRTDPHVDQRDRGTEAADLLHELWDGMQLQTHAVRLPIVPPNVSLFTAAGPFAELVAMGRDRMTDRIANVSVMGGFAYSDTAKNGLHVIVTGRGPQGGAEARALCRDIADRAWANRERFICEAVSVEAAAQRALDVGRDASLPRTLYADLGDNCGAGGPSNTLWLMEAFHAAGVQGALIAGFCDPRLVDEATARGRGASFEARFQGDRWDREDGGIFAAPARVLALHDGPCVGRHGIVAGRTIDPGRMALLDLGGLQVSLTERRTQVNDPVFLESLGVEIASLRGLVVKLRATFRVAYDEDFAPENMIFVDTPGRTSPMLGRHPWKNLPRPVYPLDRDFDWAMPDG